MTFFSCDCPPFLFSFYWYFPGFLLIYISCCYDVSSHPLLTVWPGIHQGRRGGGTRLRKDVGGRPWTWQGEVIVTILPGSNKTHQDWSGNNNSIVIFASYNTNNNNKKASLPLPLSPQATAYRSCNVHEGHICRSYKTPGELHTLRL